jgi:hypothetical protein
MVIDVPCSRMVNWGSRQTRVRDRNRIVLNGRNRYESTRSDRPASAGIERGYFKALFNGDK